MEKKMPEVIGCEATECLYNSDGKCHTFGITIGDEEPMCDTYKSSKGKGGIEDIMAGVGACHTSSCKYNENYECSANSIIVKMKSGHADCGTYQ